MSDNTEALMDFWELLHDRASGIGYYNVFHLINQNMGMEALRQLFPDAQADALNLVMFSTSGVHGSYVTIEECEEDPSLGLTFLVIHPRTVTMRYGNCTPNSPEDFAFLKKLRASSGAAMMSIATRSPSSAAVRVEEVPEGSVLTAGQILAADRRSNMTNDEALRFGRHIETMVLQARAALPPAAHKPVAFVSKEGNRLVGILRQELPVGTDLYLHALPPAVQVPQPIETAPKGGTCIHAWRTHGPFPLVVKFDVVYGEFQDVFSGDHIYNLTHWMPLPPPPAAPSPTSQGGENG